MVRRLDEDYKDPFTKKVFKFLDTLYRRYDSYDQILDALMDKFDMDEEEADGFIYEYETDDED